MEDYVLILVIILILLTGLDFLKKPALLKNRKYIVLWSISTVIFLAIAIIPGIWVQIQKFKLTENRGIIQIIPAIMMIAVITLALVKLIVGSN